MEDDDNYGLFENPFGMNEDSGLIGPNDELSDLGISLSNLPLDDNHLGSSNLFGSPTVDRLEIENESTNFYPFSPERIQSSDGMLNLPGTNGIDFSVDQNHSIQPQISQMTYQQQAQQEQMLQQQQQHQQIQQMDQPIITTSTTVIPIPIQQQSPYQQQPQFQQQVQYQQQYQQQQIQQQFIQQQQIQQQSIQRQQLQQQEMIQQQQQSLLQTPSISINQFQPQLPTQQSQIQHSSPPLAPSSKHRRSKSNLTPLIRYSHTRSQSDSSAAFAIINHNIGLSVKLQSSIPGSPNFNGNSSDTNKSESGKRYLCSRCHQCKKGHICPFPLVRKGSVDYSQMISSETQVDLSITATPPYLSDFENNNYNEKILFPRPYNSVSDERESNVSDYGNGYDG